MPNDKFKIIVKVVVKKSSFDELEFDVIDENGCVKSFNLDGYQIRQYRAASERDIIQNQIEQHLESLLDYNQDYILKIYFA